MSAYASLLARHREVSFLNYTLSLLSWDEETYLPSAAQAYRAEQCAYFSGKIHELLTDSTYGKYLDLAEKESVSDAWQHANLQLMREQFEREMVLPQAFVEELSHTESLSKAAWVEARSQDDFSSFAPHLQKLIDLNRQKAERIGFQTEAYDALLHHYERGAKAADLAQMFDQLEGPISQLAKEVIDPQSPQTHLPGHFPIPLQQQLNAEVLESLGFDTTAGRIDTTAHPFCTTLGPKDVRLTTRYDEQDFTSSLFGVLHEAGHGLYEQGLPEAQLGLPAGQAASLGIHESQSRLWENHVGRSIIFWQRWYPRAQEIFPQLKHLSLENFMKWIQTPRWNFIRVDSDELTYDLHIMLRFRLERDMINSRLEAKELPQRWNEMHFSLTGQEVPSDRLGCLQDIHWAMGALSYFPTYSIGNLASAQLFAHAQQDQSVKIAFESGDFLPLRDWMREHIHGWGSFHLPMELIQRSTQQPLHTAPYFEHLRKRFAH